MLQSSTVVEKKLAAAIEENFNIKGELTHLELIGNTPDFVKIVNYYSNTTD